MKTRFVRLVALFSMLPMLQVVSAQTIQFFTPNTVRVVRDRAEGAADDGMMQRSLVVTAQPEKVSVRVSKVGNATVYSSSRLKVTVADGKVSFSDAKGNPLMSEGETAFTPIQAGPDKGAYRVRQTFSLDQDEELYGVGLLQNGKMSQRGEDRRMEQSNLEDYAHFYQSIKGYGVYWDNYSPTRIVTPAEGKAGDVVLESEVGTRSDYYFMYGGDADGVIRAMRALTGKSPMLPLWTYGFHQSRERYKSMDQLLEVVRTYRQLGIPFDGIIQDWQYWGSNYTWNAMEFLHDDFRDAQKMIDEVHQTGAHITISIWQSFGPMTKQFRELQDKGMLFSFETWPQSGIGYWPPRMDYPSGVKVYNAYADEARDLYWRYLSHLNTMGIDAWWMDSTDPDHHSYKDSDLDEKCLLGTRDSVSYRAVRNLYPFFCVGGVYDHQMAADGGRKRPFILTRSYFAGQQRYGANVWSGDIESSWTSFRKQIPICLNFTLTANPQVNTDISGFFAGRYNTHGGHSGDSNPQFQELYVRWLQFGAFCPMMRSHGADLWREIYHYGKQGEPVYDAMVDAIKLRYRFMPYIYSQSWQVSQYDDSFMRALFMDFRDDRNTWNNSRQYLFGRNILVCPVVDPLYTPEELQSGEYVYPDWKAMKQYEVYLPAGADWYDYWTGNRLQGGQSLMADAPLAHSPLYVKAGTILPMGPDVQYTNQKPWDNLELRIYPGANAEFTLYEDEGDNMNYEQGAYSTIKMTWNDRSRSLTISARQGSFPGMLNERQFTVVTPSGQKTVTYTGRKLTVSML